MGKRRIIAETGAGQHGVATATVCALMNMECVVYMGKTDVERQHINVQKMVMLGATVYPVDYPDYLIACVGGGSNAAGTIYHYVNDDRVKIVLAEAGGKGIDTGMSAATIQLGKIGIIHGSKTLVMQSQDGQIEEPYSISAGLDYPGIGPIHANLATNKRATVLAINDDEALNAAFELTRLEGIIPALESAHALGALGKLRFRPEDVVVLTVSGRGDKDMETYIREMKNK